MFVEDFSHSVIYCFYANCFLGHGTVREFRDLRCSLSRTSRIYLRGGLRADGGLQTGETLSILGNAFMTNTMRGYILILNYLTWISLQPLASALLPAAESRTSFTQQANEKFYKK